MNERIAEINRGLRAIQDGWPFLLLEIEKRIKELTTQLVNSNNEETRGRIKALVDLTEWPDALDQERAGLMAALSEQDAATET